MSKVDAWGFPLEEGDENTEKNTAYADATVRRFLPTVELKKEKVVTAEQLAKQSRKQERHLKRLKRKEHRERRVDELLGDALNVREFMLMQHRKQ